MVINLTQLANNLYLDLDCSGYHKNLIQQYCLKLWPADEAVSIEMYFFLNDVEKNDLFQKQRDVQVHM